MDKLNHEIKVEDFLWFLFYGIIKTSFKVTKLFCVVISILTGLAELFCVAGGWKFRDA